MLLPTDEVGGIVSVDVQAGGGGGFVVGLEH